MTEERSLLSRVVTWTLLAVLAIVAIKVVLHLVGVVLGLAGFLLFTVAPVVLVGWLAIRAWKAFSREPAL